MGVINIAADHQMFIPLTGKRSWQRLRRSAVDLYSKSEKSLFESPYSALRGNVRTPSMARWKAHGRFYIHRNWTFFAISYGWDVMSRNRSKSAFFEGGGSLWMQISEWRGHRRFDKRCHSWYQSSRVIALSCGIKISAVRHLVLSQCTHVTDGQMDGQTDRITTSKTALAYARAVMTEREINWQKADRYEPKDFMEGIIIPIKKSMCEFRHNQFNPLCLKNSAEDFDMRSLCKGSWFSWAGSVSLHKGCGTPDGKPCWEWCMKEV